jgi:RNA polymerase sigma factor (sigma-70 family)
MSDADAAAFCDRVRTRLVGALTLTCGDRDVAEELAQDTLVRVWERWAQVSAMDSPEGWTFRTAFNLASSWRRRRAAERRANRRATEREPAPQDGAIAETEIVRRAVSSLPERQRAVIVARFYLGYDVAGTAQLLGCAPGTVKATTSQALGNLRRRGLMPDIEGQEEVEVQ